MLIDEGIADNLERVHPGAGDSVQVYTTAAVIDFIVFDDHVVGGGIGAVDNLPIGTGVGPVERIIADIDMIRVFDQDNHAGIVAVMSFNGQAIEGDVAGSIQLHHPVGGTAGAVIGQDRITGIGRVGLEHDGIGSADTGYGRDGQLLGVGSLLHLEGHRPGYAVFN